MSTSGRTDPSATPLDGVRQEPPEAVVVVEEQRLHHRIPRQRLHPQLVERAARRRVSRGRREIGADDAGDLRAAVAVVRRQVHLPYPIQHRRDQLLAPAEVVVHDAAAVAGDLTDPGEGEPARSRARDEVDRGVDDPTLGLGTSLDLCPSVTGSAQLCPCSPVLGRRESGDGGYRDTSASSLHSLPRGAIRRPAAVACPPYLRPQHLRPQRVPAQDVGQ